MHVKALRVLYKYNGIFVLAGSLLGPLYAIYVERLQKGILTVSASWAAFLVSTTIFSLVLTRVGDRVKEKEYLLLAGFLIRAVAWFSYIYIRNISQLIGLQILLGLGEAVGTPAFEVIFAEHLEKGKHIDDYADWKVVVNLVTAVGTILGGLIASRFGFTPLFLAMSLLALVAFFGVLFKPRRLL
ncbi:MAG: MFS transporter [Candidatus Beckwithbacteria bacterium]|nr:MFS transporter [Candidatus Beckwithbacteria bacterium]